MQDGDLPAALSEVITAYKRSLPLKLLRVAPAAKRHFGLGHALRSGVECSAHEIILRFDTDDICLTNRCEVQVGEMAADPSLILYSSNIIEFSSTTHHLTASRNVPLTDESIRAWLPRRNPLNHMTVGYRKSAVLAAGNYEDMPLFEDYWLWLRMAKVPGRIKNSAAPFVFARAGQNLALRRHGMKTAAAEFHFQKVLLRRGFIHRGHFFANLFSRVLSRLMPLTLYEILYGKILRARPVRLPEDADGRLANEMRLWGLKWR